MDIALRAPPMETIEVGARSGAQAVLTVESVDLPWLNARPEAWDRLVHDAGQAAPFQGRLVVNAHVRHGLAPEPRFLVVRRGERLLALLAYELGGARLGWRLRANAIWHSPYTPTTMPLVAADAVGPAVSALLDGMAGLPGQVWHFPQAILDDAVGLALRAEIGRRAWSSDILVSHERPVFDRRTGEGASPPAGRQKDLRRRLRRLAETGPVEFRTVTAGSELRSAIEAFLVLEAEGWKGRRGTALASRSNTAAFARDLLACEGPDDGPVRARADLLLLDGRPVAVSLALLCNRTAFLWKAAYDESLARYAPGILLEDAIVRAMHETGFTDRLNSAAPAGSVLEQLYPDRELVGDLIFATSPDLTSARLAALGASEMRVRRLRQRAADLYWAWRDRRSTRASGRESVEA
jgi:CelD/BcsL family acetyltransferase involved in cellulose biosynthesis